MHQIIISFILLGVVLLASIILIFIAFFKVLLPLIFCGAIYVPSKQDKIKKMIEFAEIKSGEKAVDLGSGDGRLVIALAKAGAEAYGYEVNPVLARRSQRNIQEAELENRAFVKCKSFWQADLSEFDVIVIYGMQHVMGRLEKKLNQELKRNARVVCNVFDFPNWPQIKKKDGVYLYNNPTNRF